MNKTTAIFLVRKDVRCISVSYDKQINLRTQKIEPVDVKSFKTVDHSIKEKDLVLIPTDSRWGFTVGRVEAVDLHVDFDSPEQMRWVVSKIDTATFKAMIEAESKMMDTVADADRKHRETELKNKLFANVDPSLLDNFQLSAPIAPPASGFEPGQRGGAQVNPPPAPMQTPEVPFDPDFF